MPVTHRRTCHICEANCGVIVTAEGRDILSIKGDPDNAMSRGHVCPKATAIADLQNDPDRLRRPMTSPSSTSRSRRSTSAPSAGTRGAASPHEPR